uniref:Protein phosphatase Slingshot homolog 1 n=1 Tax=Sinocyclocheilus anshuiensis TaxID=1608454 RepID=A0A671QK76_9TELE
FKSLGSVKFCIVFIIVCVAYFSLSESFFMVKGAALFLQQGSSAQGPRTPTHHKNAGDLPQHLQVMINTLRAKDRIKLVVRLESGWTDHVRYMVVVYTNGRQDTEENILLGTDFTDNDSKSCSIGMTLPIWSDTKIHLDGDGGFSVSTAGRLHVFKPVSVQAMWSALQVMHKACEVSRRYNYFPGGMALTWVGYYESCISSEQSCINEWNAMTDLETTRPDSPVMFSDQPTERERTECMIKAKLRNIMMFQDLENITSKEIRNELEQHMSCNLREYKEFIDNEMLLILGQIDKATLIFDHLYLGSEWNASNLEELQDSGVGYILNVTREIDNFFPGTFCYCNIRVYDDETTDLLAHWNETYNFIVKAKKNNSKCLVHCKMGVSRSASTVIAYAMKEYGWSLEKACTFVKQKRNIAQPNPAFMKQLAEYEGILDDSKQRHNKLWQPDGDEYSLEGLQASAASDTALDIFIEIEDVERDALLDDEGFPMAHLALPGEGTAAQTCSRLEPIEDMRLRLEFSTVEEEDEEEAQKEEAEMAALARGEKMPREDESLANSNRFNNENDSASIGNPYKVKPSYQSCRDCLHLPSGRRCERRTHRLNLSRHTGLPSMSIQAPRGHKFSPVSANKVPPPAPLHHMSSGHCQCIRCFGRANSDTCHKQPSCEDLPQDLRYSLETEDRMEGEDEGRKESSSSPVTELTLLRLSLGGERPTAELSQGAHLETQLVQMSGPPSEQMDLSIEDSATEDMEVDEGNVPSSHPGSSKLQQTLAPGSALTRSSSSDSLPRICRGQPGSVCQRAREIETRVRLAGLTMSSQLKRSNSLAKLGDLAISAEDLTLSTAVSVDYNDQEPALCVQSSCSPKLSLTPTVLQSLKS